MSAGRWLRAGAYGLSRTLHSVGWTPVSRSVRDLRVLLYHGLGNRSDPAMRHLEDEIPPDAFISQLDYVSDRYEMVSLEDGLLRQTTTRRPLCAVTFDDGLRSVITDAAPLLHRRGIPASVFLNTAVVGTTKKLWQHQLSAVIVRDGLERTLTALRDFVDLPRRIHSGLRLIDFVQHHFAACSGFVDWIQAQETGGGALYLNWDEVAALSRLGLTCYSHTAHHLPLAHVPPPLMRSEIDEAWAAMTRAGTSAAFVSFPFGMESDFGRGARAYALTRHAFAIEVEDGWNPLPRVQATHTIRRVCLEDEASPVGLYALIELLPLIKGRLKRTAWKAAGSLKTADRQMQ